MPNIKWRVSWQSWNMIASIWVPQINHPYWSSYKTLNYLSRSSSKQRKEHNHTMTGLFQYPISTWKLPKRKSKNCVTWEYYNGKPTLWALSTFIIAKRTTLHDLSAILGSLTNGLWENHFQYPKSAPFNKNKKASYMPKPLISTWATTPLDSIQVHSKYAHYLAVEDVLLPTTTNGCCMFSWHLQC